MMMSFILIMLSYFLSSVISLVISIIILVVSIFYILLITSIEIFIKDKQIDFKSALEQDLHIVACINCKKDNVYEDKYCIYCGEKLEYNDE